MESWWVRFPKKSAGAGAAIGLAFGAFTATPWGTFSGPESPGLWLAAPLMLAFVLIGAWFGTVLSLSTVDSAAGEPHAHTEDGHAILDRGHPTPA